MVQLHKVISNEFNVETILFLTLWHQNQVPSVLCKRPLI